ncbi:MAG: septum formation initiator family protein [Mycobacteriales bacterium]
MPSKRRPQNSRAKRQVNAVRRTKAPEPASHRRGLTTRAAVLGLVVCALVVSAALPLREYLSQRSEIEAARQELQAKAARVAALEQRKQLLEDPAYVKQLARERLHYVMPGEIAYVVLSPSASPAPGTAGRAGVAATGPEAPWYSQVWGSVRAADRPAPLPRHTP